MIRRLFALIAAAILLAAGAPPAQAAADPAAGEPTITDESATGYYVWHDDGGVHLRTHGPGDDHRFVADLHTDGEFRDVESVRAESRDDVAVLNGGHTLALRFQTYAALDGVNFRIEGGSFLRLRLQLDGRLIDADHIFLGADGAHPAHNPFTIWR
jgi:hypothetical protein